MRSLSERRSVSWLVVVTIWLGINVATASEPATPTPPFELFRNSLKQEKDRFLLNGNWVSEADLRKIWDRKEAQDKSDPSSRDPNNSDASTPLKNVHPDLSLNVNLIKGELDYWARSEDRLLSYAIDRSSMTTQEYETVQRAMAEAAGDWERACPQCGIKFEYKRKFDHKPSFNKVRFIVRKTDSGGMLASSFYPSTPKNERFITVTPDFFKDGDFSQAGVFRHNLGHVLGYRHEHISPEAGPGCFSSEPPTFITGSYDPKSVMHYFCGGGGTKDMRLSERDITSHQLLYGFATIQVDIEGKDFLGLVARIMSEISKVYSRLPFGVQHLGTSDGCRAYLKDLGLLEALASENIEGGKACSVFASLARNVDGKSQFPLLPFNHTTDFASGAALNTDREAFREFAELRDRVNPFNLNTNWRPSGVRHDTKIFNYEMEWNRYTANVPVSPLELPPVKSALGTLSDKDPNIKISVDDAIGKSLTLPRAVKQNAVVVHPIEGLDAICAPDSESFGVYPMMLDGNLEKQDFEEKSSGPNDAGIPQLRCDVPEENQALCNSCGNGKCGSEECSVCGVCRKTSAVVIDESIDPESLSYPAAPPAEPICKWRPFEARHHGTLMAQIVAGSNKFAGFMPHLDLKFVKYDAKVLAPTFDAELSAKLRDQRAGVAIVTNQFCYPAALMKDFIKDLPAGSSLCEIMGDVKINAGPGDRQRLLAQHLPTKRIRNSRDWLWVAAIGQPAGVNRVLNPPSPTTFDESSIASPIVLADKSNVMLVSACEKCSVQRNAVNNRRNWSSAHRGKAAFRPHVIAPGGIEAREKKNGEWIGGVPGFGVGKEAIRAYGTSQAAAFVGGLAAKMLACYPNYYGAPSRLKEAVQFTSMPVLPDGGEEDSVTTGLVDVRAALRNPSFVYFKDDGEGDAQFARIPRNRFNWCSSVLNFKQPGGAQTDEIPVESIRRIVQIPVGAAARWVVYYRKAGEDGSVQDGAIFKSPLYAGIQAKPDNSETIFSSNGQNKTLSDVQDLLLFDEFGPGPCSP